VAIEKLAVEAEVGSCERRSDHVEEDVEYQKLVEMLHDKYQPAHEDGYVFKG